MNERILEIAKQAGLKGYFEDDLSLQEKVFVQLIVQECAGIADEPTSLPFQSYGKKIKEHFGVKE